MKTLLTMALLIMLFSSFTYGQISMQGPSAKVGYSTLTKFSFGLGYTFMHYKGSSLKDPGTILFSPRTFSHNYYLDYLPATNSIGVSANLQYAIYMFKAGVEAAFRTKDTNGNSYF